MKLSDSQYTDLLHSYIQRIIEDMTTKQLEQFVFDTYADMYEGLDDESLIDEVNKYDAEIVRKVLN
jgi:hypothetical protein